MSNFSTLLKVQFLEIFNSNNQKKKNTKKTVGMASAIVGLIVLCLFISVCYNYLIFDTYRQIGMISSYLPLVFILTSLVIVVTGLIKVKATLFGNKDYNMLESMPIKHSTIIACKIFVIYLYELVFSIAFIGPAIVIANVYEFNAQNLVFSIIAMILLPIFPILIGGIIGLPMAFLFDKTKYGSYIALVLYVVYIVALMYFIYGKSDVADKANMYNAIVNNVNKFYFISKWYTKALEGNALPMLYFGVSHIAFLIIFIVLASLSYKPINNNIMSKNVRVEYVSKKLESSSVGKALLKNEFKRMTSSTNILLNTLLGGIMSILMLIIMYFSFKEPMGEYFDEFKTVLYPFMIILICFGLGVSPISATNISLEGESFWIIKSAPISEDTIIKYKLLPAIIIALPFSLIASIISIIIFGIGVVGSIATVVIPILYIILMCMIGTFAQLHFPKMHWSNELDVIKRAKSVVVTMFISFGVDIVMAGVIVGLGLFVNMYLAFSVLALLLLIGIGFFYYYINKNGRRLFNQIA